jgi:hypothetical protein
MFRTLDSEVGLMTHRHSAELTHLGNMNGAEVCARLPE